MKTTVQYECGECGCKSPKWIGRCPQCEKWNTFSEEVRVSRGKISASARTAHSYESLIKGLSAVDRFTTAIGEIDRVLGGGVVPGALILLTGEPGIGKSTLTLQIAHALSAQKKKVLYISGEESEEQVALRAQRLGLRESTLHIISETNIETALATSAETACDFLIIDSIQVSSSDRLPAQAGSVSQVRFCTELVAAFAKPRKLPVLLIGHVTKDGTLAGPRALEHLVDAVLYLEGERSSDARILRCVKNRFGSASEIGVFQMNEKGLEEVADAGSYFVSGREDTHIGSVLSAVSEGSRPILIEIQALTSPSVFGYPRRTATGFDVNRLQILLAVLQKYLKINFNAHDVFVNVVGGYRIEDPGCDAAVCLALLSSFFHKPVPGQLMALGEVGLAGEIRTRRSLKKIETQIDRLNFTPLTGCRNVQQLRAKFFSSEREGEAPNCAQSAQLGGGDVSPYNCSHECSK